MRAEEIKNNFSKNIKILRERKHLTQVQLGAELGYSDKSISKWEKGDVMPDIATLDHIAKYFNLSVNDLIEAETSKVLNKKDINKLIVAICFFSIVTLASIIFFVLSIFGTLDRLWLVYIYTLPVFCIVFIVLSSVFFNYKLIILSISMLVWSITLTLYLTFINLNIWTIFIIGASVQLLLIFILFIIKRRKTSKE